MWNNLRLENFKCHASLSLPLAPLSLLTGSNASGKSTVLQSLVLLNQTMRRNRSGKRIILNGDSVQLGAIRDVANSAKSKNSFTVGIDAGACDCVWTTFNENRDDLMAAIQSIDIASSGGPRFRWCAESPATERGVIAVPPQIPLEALLPVNTADTLADFPNSSLKELSMRLSSLTYIRAERIGPRETYAMFPGDEDMTVGVSGERTAWFLDQFADKEVIGALRLPDATPKLQRQVERRLQTFFPGAGFRVVRVREANLVTMSMRSSEASDFYRPQNVGYGLTHVLPIITACVAATPGDLILIENPEAHLHPAGQSEIGRLLATVAAAGVQLIVETHSDHVLNGIRVAVKEDIIPPEQVSIAAFARDIDNPAGEVRVSFPQVDRHGKIAEWPPGFFDEAEKLLLQLL